MTQQISTFATGELSASIEGHDKFNAQNVEFMGSTGEPDFYCAEWMLPEA